MLDFKRYDNLGIVLLSLFIILLSLFIIPLSLKFIPLSLDSGSELS